MVRMLQDQVPGQGAWRHRFEAGEAYVAIDADEPARRFGLEHLNAPSFGRQTYRYPDIDNLLASGRNKGYVHLNR